VCCPLLFSGFSGLDVTERCQDKFTMAAYFTKKEEVSYFLVLSWFRLAPVICDYFFLFAIKIVRLLSSNFSPFSPPFVLLFGLSVISFFEADSAKSLCSRPKL
jgi:hypothetical protein